MYVIPHPFPLKKEHVLKEHGDVFTGIGCFPGPPYNIENSQDVPLVQRPPKASPNPASRCLQRTDATNVLQPAFYCKYTMSTRYVLIPSGIADDTFVCVESEAEHDQHTINVLDTARENNVRFNPNNFTVKSRPNVILRVYVDPGWRKSRRSENKSYQPPIQSLAELQTDNGPQ